VALTPAAKVWFWGTDMTTRRLFILVAAGLMALLAASGSQAEGISLARIPHIYEVVIDPVAPDHLILATPRGLYRLTPDIKMLPLLDDSHDVTGLVVSDSGKHLLASGKTKGQSFGVLISADRGKTWQPQMQEPASKPAIRLMRITGPKGQLLAVTRSLVASKNTGKSWSDSHEMPTGLLGLATSRKSIRDLLAATAKGLKSSSNGGKSWQDVDVGPANRPASMVAQDGRNRAWTFIVSAGLFARKTQGNWQKLASAVDFDGALIHLTGQKTDPDHLVAVTQYMKILRSKDGGKTWSAYRKAAK
jgi:photosystem II stability/assembly factor-like uncharacterized protein